MKRLLHKGKITTLYGSRDVGKSSIAYSLMNEKCVYLTNHKMDLHRIKDFDPPKNMEDILVASVVNTKEIETHIEGIRFSKAKLIIVDTITQIYRLLKADGNANLFPKILKHLADTAKLRNSAVLLIADTYMDFNNEEVKITAGDVLKYMSYCFAGVSKEGSLNLVEVHKPKLEKIYFRIKLEGLNIFKTGKENE